MVLTEMLTLNYPYFNVEKEEMVEKIKKGVLFDMPKREPINSWIASCTKIEPRDRPTAEQLVETIKKAYENIK